MHLALTKAMRDMDVLAVTVDTVMNTTIPIGAIGDKPSRCMRRANLARTADFPQGFPRE
jgi:hypothetical protein